MVDKSYLFQLQKKRFQSDRGFLHMEGISIHREE